MASVARVLNADDYRIQYTGRMSIENGEAKLLYAGSYLRIRFRGTSLSVVAADDSYGIGNWLGAIIDDGSEIKVYVDEGEEQTIELASGLSTGVHEAIIWKRSVATNGVLTLKKIILDPGGTLLSPPARPERRIVIYGDSVAAGKMIEAVGYEGEPDANISIDTSLDQLSNGHWAFGAVAARRLNAEYHQLGLSGLGVLDGTGTWGGKDKLGLETTFTKLIPIPGRLSEWEMTNFRPHLIVVAMGQNSAGLLFEDTSFQQRWSSRYKAILRYLTEIYPDATVLVTTSVMRHGDHVEELVANIVQELRQEDKSMLVYRFKRAGQDAGHPRLAQHQEMADELTEFIEALPHLWDDPTVPTQTSTPTQASPTATPIPTATSLPKPTETPPLTCGDASPPKQCADNSFFYMPIILR